MPFDFLEKSANAGRPEELYEFSVGTEFWRVTSRSQLATFLSYEFQPLEGLRRTSFKMAAGGGDDSITLDVPMHFEIAKMFEIASPPMPILLKIYRHHRGDGDSYGLAWNGRVRGCEWLEGAIARLHCDGATSMLSRHTLRLSFDSRCPHMLYDAGCKLNPEDWKISAPVESVTRNSIVSSAFATRPSDWLALGYVKYLSYRFMISSHAANTITVFTPVNLTKLPQAVVCEAYAGCDHLLNTCWDKFQNGLNSEANPWIPDRDPFRVGV